MASSINASTTAGLVNTADTSGVLQLQTAGTTAISIDASQAVSFTNSPTVTGGTANGVAYLNGSKVLTTGSALVFDGTNLGVGVTPSTTTFSGSKMLQVGFSPNVIQGITSGNFSMIQGAFFNSAGNMQSLGTGLKNTLYSQTDGSHQWFNAPVTSAGSSVSFTQAMTLDSSGYLLVGTTGVVGKLTVGGTIASSYDGFYVGESTYRMQVASGQIQVINGSGGVYLPSGGTGWGSLSDENLKNITGLITNGIDAVKSLRAARYTWKSDETNKPQVGLIAQDIQAVLPEAVDENSDGFLGVRYSDVIPLLVAAIQEQQALITQLQADVAALKGA